MVEQKQGYIDGLVRDVQGVMDMWLDQKMFAVEDKTFPDWGTKKIEVWSRQV